MGTRHCPGNVGEQLSGKPHAPCWQPGTPSLLPALRGRVGGGQVAPFLHNTWATATPPEREARIFKDFSPAV